MEGRIEHRDVGYVRQPCSGRAQGIERRRVVQRRKPGERFDTGLDIRIDHDCVGVTISAVDDPMTDGKDLCKIKAPAIERLERHNDRPTEIRRLDLGPLAVHRQRRRRAHPVDAQPLATPPVVTDHGDLDGGAPTIDDEDHGGHVEC